MKAYIIGLFATVVIVALNILAGNAASGFAPIHCWALAIIAAVACGIGAYQEWFRHKIIKMVEEAGLLDEIEDSADSVAFKLIDKLDRDREDNTNDE